MGKKGVCQGCGQAMGHKITIEYRDSKKKRIIYKCTDCLEKKESVRSKDHDS